MRTITPFDINPLEDTQTLKRYSKTFLAQLMPYIAHIIPAKNSSGLYSASSIFETLKLNEAYQLHGVKFSGEQLLNYYRLFGLMPVSNYLAKQTESPQFCSAVPIPLAAYRLQLGIPYSKWDKTDPCLVRMFSPQMQWILDQKVIDSIPDLNRDEVNALREQVLLERKSGTIKPVISYKFELSGEPVFDRLPKLLRMMLLQTWIFHPSIRHQNMITDPINWDSAAEPWDLVNDVVIIPPQKQAFSPGDELPW